VAKLLALEPPVTVLNSLWLVLTADVVLSILFSWMDVAIDRFDDIVDCPRSAVLETAS
jgi:hypothetical protein